MFLTAPALLLLSLACKDKDADSGAVTTNDTADYDWPDRGPDPWEGASATALDPLRAVLKVRPEGAGAPSRLLTVGARALTGVLDPGAGAVHVLDQRYHHQTTPECLELSFFEGF